MRSERAKEEEVKARIVVVSSRVRERGKDKREGLLGLSSTSTRLSTSKETLA